MLLDDNEQQLSTDSFQCTPIDLSSVLLRRDEFSEIIANMTKTLHMNTPEQTMNGIDIDDFDSNNGNKQQLIEQLQSQLIHNQMQRTQPRNYTRILNQSNTPAHWYKAPSNNRSVYFYDPNYQKYVQQQTINLPRKIKPNIRLSPSQLSRLNNYSNSTQNSWYSITPRTKYMFDLYTTAVNYQKQKQHLNSNNQSISSPNISRQNFLNSSRIHLIPTLPPINSSKQRNEQEYNLSNTNDKNSQSIFLSESRKKINQIVMPPTS